MKILQMHLMLPIKAEPYPLINMAQTDKKREGD